MSNLADYIEKFILRRLSLEQDNIIILRRNEIAEELECAPSQISYVLNTRFTVSRGFVVESRRGSGGYVRIAKIALRDFTSDDSNSDDRDGLVQPFATILSNMVACNFITKREARLISNFDTVLRHYNIDAEEHRKILHSLILGLTANE